MKRLIFVMLAFAVVVGCEPSVRYSPAPPKPHSADNSDDGDASGSADAQGTVTIIDTERMGSIIEGYLGTKYRRGGYGRLGIDCSGLVYVVYRDFANLHLPPNTKKLFNRLSRVDKRELAYGDLVFFSFNGDYVSHVGIYIGDNKFVHASESRGVIISSLSERYYRDTFVGARRVLG